MRTALFGFCVSVCLLSNAFALNFPGDVDFFEFPGWSHGAVVGGGQVFQDVFGTVDVTVNAAGSFSIASKVKGPNDRAIISGLATPGTNSFTFTLSEALPVVINYQTVDPQEMLTITAMGTMTNTLLYGAAPTTTSNPGSLQLVGTGFGVGAAGASRGYVELSPVSSFTVTHTGTANKKFEAFRVGTVVPEPTGIALGLLGLFSMALLRRG